MLQTSQETHYREGKSLVRQIYQERLPRDTRQLHGEGDILGIIAGKNITTFPWVTQVSEQSAREGQPYLQQICRQSITGQNVAQ